MAQRSNDFDEEVEEGGGKGGEGDGETVSDDDEDSRLSKGTLLSLIVVMKEPMIMMKEPVQAWD
jgi:hypothetical protein